MAVASGHLDVASAFVCMAVIVTMPVPVRMGRAVGMRVCMRMPVPVAVVLAHLADRRFAFAAAANYTHEPCIFELKD